MNDDLETESRLCINKLIRSGSSPGESVRLITEGAEFESLTDHQIIENEMTLHIVLPSGNVAVLGTLFSVTKQDLKYFVQKYPLCWVEN